MKKRIQVLLSTYNGEKYIKQQIDSILNQKNVNINILIRDDGSKDKTCSIIESYRSSQIVLIKGENIGATNSFLELIKYSGEYDYYSFADQDDVWDEDKLITGISKIKEYHNKPSIYSSNARLVNSELELIEIRNRNPKVSLGSALISNYVAGCTAVFNKELMLLLKKKSPTNLPYHDWWANLVALSVGGISIYDNTPHINYRQHENNVVGASGNIINRWSNRFKKYLNKSYHRELMAEQILNHYDNIIPEENKVILMDIMQYKNNKIRLILNKNIRTNNIIDNIMFWICVITNKI